MTWQEEQISKFLENFKSQELAEFDRTIEKYPDIKELLFTKLKDMEKNLKYQKYLNLILPSERFYFRDRTLHELIDYSMTNRFLNHHSGYVVLYSYNKEYPVGWFCYHYAGEDVKSIKMFSFGTNDLTFMKDVKKEFDNICQKYSRIEWIAVKANPFIKHYIKAILKYKGRCSDLEGEGISFVIDKKYPNEDFSNLKDLFSGEILNKIKI